MAKRQFNPNALWFENCRDDFFAALNQYKNKPANFLEIGCYEGYCTTWLLDNILTHPDSQITCVDPWDFPKGEETYIRFNENVGTSTKVIVRRVKSGVALRYLEAGFDFVYIDGDHTDYHPLEDAVLSFPLLKSGGIICFDDYEWPTHDAATAIDAFLTVYKNHYDMINKGYQVWIRKK